MRMKSRCSPAASRTVSWFQNTVRSEEHTSELQSRLHLVCRLLLEKKKNNEPFSWCPCQHRGARRGREARESRVLLRHHATESNSHYPIDSSPPPPRGARSTPPATS